MSLATIAAMMTLFTGAPCAAIDNGPNTAAWAIPGKAPITAHYSDEGERLVYRPAPKPRQNGAWRALHKAEASLQVGKPGPKRRIACAY